MPKPKNKVPSVRIRLDGYQTMPIIDPRIQKTLEWYLKNKETRKAFPIAWQLLIAAVNGELGSQVQAAVNQGSTEEAIDALHDLMATFGGGPDI